MPEPDATTSDELAPGDESAFQREAETGRTGIVTEFWDFLKHNKKWWLLPIVAVLLLLGLIVTIGGTAVGPVIYTLF